MNRRKAIRNILIFGHSNIGDVVYDLAVVDPLRTAYPDSKISFLTSVRCKDIADGYKSLDRIILFDRHGKDKGFKRLGFMADLRKERFDLALILSSSLNHLFLGIPNIWSLKKGALKAETSG
jgi:heptosyltransferase II